MNEEKIKKNIYRTMLCFFALFLILMLHITYLQMVGGAELAKQPVNVRADDRGQQRGSITDCKGEVLAVSKKNDQDEFYRVYPLGAICSNITGYFSVKLGRTGIESYCDSDLSGRNDPWRKLGAISHLVSGGAGNQVRLTIDTAVQKAAYQALGDRKGAIVVLDPKTGAILAMVSKPSFDPNQLEDNWETVRTDADSPLLNRATQGLYPPGSVFKTLIADAALQEKLIGLDTAYDCPGYLKFDEAYTLHESGNKAHGKVNLEKALEVSCNVTFAQLALKLGAEGLQKAFDRFGFGKYLDNEIIESKWRLPDFDRLNQGELAQIGIGQGDLLVTPLRMALLAGAFANGGTIMKPHLIDAVLAPGGSLLTTYEPEKWLDAATPERAKLIKQFMRTTVLRGTAAAAAVEGIEVTGKTGTAENASGETHAWFIGTASLKAQEAAFAIIVENGGGGGSDAAPIARKIIINSLMN